MEAILEISQQIASFWVRGRQGHLKVKESLSYHCELPFLVLYMEYGLEYSLLRMTGWDGEKAVHVEFSNKYLHVKKKK